MSGWRDSNPRPPAPHAGAIPGYATSRKLRNANILNVNLNENAPYLFDHSNPVRRIRSFYPKRIYLKSIIVAGNMLAFIGASTVFDFHPVGKGFALAPAA
jgi:hypothetical protein